MALYPLNYLASLCRIPALNATEEACYRYCHPASIIKPNDVHVLSQMTRRRVAVRALRPVGRI